MKQPAAILMCLIVCGALHAQSLIVRTRAANRMYKQKKFNQAVPEYEKAAQISPDDPVNNYNLGNAYFRMEKYDDGIRVFDKTAEESNNSSLKQRAFYNKGVSYSKENKLEESIQAYKKAVILNPADSDARINLQKAMLELKKKTPPEKKEDEKNKKQKNKKEKEPPPQSKMTKKKVEQLLKALQQREQQVQQKMLQNRTRATTKPDKDW